MRRPVLSTYSHNSQREKKDQKKRKDYYYSFNQLNPEGTIHLLLKGDILTSYEQRLGRAPDSGHHSFGIIPLNNVMIVDQSHRHPLSAQRCVSGPGLRVSLYIVLMIVDPLAGQKALSCRQ